MKTFFRVKLKLIFNTSPKGKLVECLVPAETEDEVETIVNTNYQEQISNPKKTVYIFSKEADNYVPIIMDAEEDDCRLLEVEIISVKDSRISCFWGNPNDRLYMAKIRGAFYSHMFVCFSGEVAVGAKDFNEAYDIINNAFKDAKYIARQFLSENLLKDIPDKGYQDSEFEICSLRKSILFIIPNNI